MKKLFLVLPLLLLLSGCNVSEDCFRKSGSAATKIIEVPENAAFSKIYVYPNIGVVINQGEQTAITVKAGSNVIDDISAVIENDSLVLRDNSGCNLTRQYGNKTVYITVKAIPQLEIYSNTGQVIRSEGHLTIPILRLFSMDYFGGVGTGDFIFDVTCGIMDIQSNNISIFKISGQVDLMHLLFYDDLSRFEGENCIVQDLNVFQRSANDMIVSPQQSLTGGIYSTGNILCRTHPPTVEIERHYSGRLIYQD